MIHGSSRHSVCIFGKSHLTFNFKSKVSRLQKQNWLSIDSCIFFKCHLNVTCLVGRVIPISNVSIDMWFFSSQVTPHVKFYIVRVNWCAFFCAFFWRVKCQKLAKSYNNFVKYTLPALLKKKHCSSEHYSLKIIFTTLPFIDNTGTIHHVHTIHIGTNHYPY